MHITTNLSLFELAQRMGSDATEQEAEEMRLNLIAGGFEDLDTVEVPEADWNEMLQESRAK